MVVKKRTFVFMSLIHWHTILSAVKAVCAVSLTGYVATAGYGNLLFAIVEGAGLLSTPSSMLTVG